MISGKFFSQHAVYDDDDDDGDDFIIKYKSQQTNGKSLLPGLALLGQCFCCCFFFFVCVLKF